MSLVSFLKGSYYEFKDKVEWPKWPELQESTMIVAVGTLILGLFLLGVDSLFQSSLDKLYLLLINLIN